MLKSACVCGAHMFGVGVSLKAILLNWVRLLQLGILLNWMRILQQTAVELDEDTTADCC